MYYNINELKIDKDKILYKDMVKHVYKSNKDQEFTSYFTTRTLAENIPNSKKDIAIKSNVSTRTISKWDNILLDKNIISKDGFYYFYVDKNNKSIIQCLESEYKSFWRNKAYLQAFKGLQLKYISGAITLTELQLSSMDIGASIALIENKYYFRTKKYKTNKDNKLFIDTLDLIFKIHSN